MSALPNDSLTEASSDSEPPGPWTNSRTSFVPQDPSNTSSGSHDPSDTCFELQIPSKISSGTHIQTSSKEDKGRVMILCFDGTGSKPGKRVRGSGLFAAFLMFHQDSNVARFFHALRKDVRDKQIVYYQPGLGTYSKHSLFSETMETVSTCLDLAIALNLNDHIKNGYTFVVQNYRPRDKIYFFGFSRGAYTARAIVGMIYKVGLLPKESVQQVEFAFDVYMTTGHEGYELSRNFKKSFASHVDIEFLGVWDTVSSVGIIPVTHPCTSNNYSVKHFRHAISLDERRAKFRPILWSEQMSESEDDLPDVRIDFNQADVKEVWFAGAHADVGGGGRSSGRDTGLSFISLRWMIKECIAEKTGIEFDMEYLKNDLDFDIEELLKEMFGRGDYNGCYEMIEQCAWDKHEQMKSRLKAERDNDDPISDDLAGRLKYFWEVFEWFPMLTNYQDSQGNWFRRRTQNFGRGRYIPLNKNKILVHKSVKKRLENQELNYVPAAHNWKIVEDMIEYVE